MAKGQILIEGKTKRIVAGPRDGTVLMETKDELTGGDAAKRATIEGIAKHKTAQCANVFSLLNQSGIPTAFLERLDDTTLLNYECDMLPIELVMRRYAWGSFLQREPQYKQASGAPFRFDEIRCELFHKHTVVMPPNVEHPVQMDEGEARDRFLKDGAWADGVYTDPYIHIADGASTWALHPAKVPFKAGHALMEIEPVLSAEEVASIKNDLMLPCFQALEAALSRVETQYGPIALADIKIEAGRQKADGKLVIADVIDNDSWRIWPGGDPSKQLDKQNFRDGHPLSEVSDNYALVAELTRAFAA
ncbi:MAG: phosphoribosylaminoimidazole-succinocarboxamide synthase [Candidatus Entotheonella factor]|uniref:phosphoribosylaminoimidazolesuccinocarboxamide synthase n=1 Tax=Entotheonella factor TaxID=1429438 RepID=W4LS36_ENTF1|nr:phosphoribosylaminoimidazolesuccinocarboxamide synthase [Candidatus Entotheonella palauensis]ETX00844.1 MAG: phosphoribosylaminoimidazole-succinocarboxamide synthase [Candidatus Entotheonella factor]